MRPIRLLAAAAALAALAAPQAAARDVISCESSGNSYQFCRADTYGGVRVYRQLSRSACIYGSTWGYDRRGVWVTEGCRAEFLLGRGTDYGHDDYDYGDPYYDPRPGPSHADDGLSGEEAIGALLAVGIIAAIAAASDNDDNDGRNNLRVEAVKDCSRQAKRRAAAIGADRMKVDRIVNVDRTGRRAYEIDGVANLRFGGRRESRRFDCEWRAGSVTRFRYR